MDLSDPSSFADRADLSVVGAPVEALGVVAQQDRPDPPFTDGEVDRAGRTRDQRNSGGLVISAHDPRHPMAPLEGHVLDVGVADFAHPQAIQPGEHRQSGMGVVKALRGEQETAEPVSVQPSTLRGMHGGTAQLLGRVGADPAVDVSEAVEPAGGGQAAVDCRSGQATLLRRSSVQLEMRPRRF